MTNLWYIQTTNKPIHQHIRTSATFTNMIVHKDIDTGMGTDMDIIMETDMRTPTPHNQQNSITIDHPTTYTPICID